MSSHTGLIVALKMLFCALGIYASFFMWSFLQERIATHKYEVNGQPQRFKFIFVLNTVQSICAATVGLTTYTLGKFFTKKSDDSDSSGASSPTSPGSDGDKKIPSGFPLKDFIIIGFTATFASPFGYASLKHISYPMLLTVKMCKMIPILIIGALWHRRRYSPAKYLDCLLITLGVVAFTVFGEDDDENKRSATSSFLGIALVFVNLTLDGFTNSSQDEVIKKKGYAGTKMMFLTNVAIATWSVIALLAFEFMPKTPVTRPEVFAAIEFIVQQPGALKDVVMMGSLGAVGQFFIFQAISLFGSLTLTGMTVTRKVGSVLISIVAHNHSVTTEQWGALAAIVAGVFLDVWINIREKKAKDHQAYVKKHDDAHASDHHHKHHKHKHHANPKELENLRKRH